MNKNQDVFTFLMKKTAVGLALVAVVMIVLNGVLLTRGMGVSLDNTQMEKLTMSKQFEEAIDAGVDRYIQRQQEEQQKAQEEQQRAQEQKAENVEPLRDNDYVRGNRDAEVLLIEYSDFECPFCKRFHPTAQAVAEKYDNLAWVYRHFPLSIHAGADAKAQASLCVGKLGGNDAFWQFADMLLGEEENIPVDDLRPMAENLGVNGTAFQDCVDSGEMSARVLADIQKGGEAGVTGTPGSILLNTRTGKVRSIPGAVPQATLESAVDEVMGE